MVARRLMYWQVYLHKTSLGAEQLLIRVLKRAKELSQKGVKLPATTALSFFLTTPVNIENFNNVHLEKFSKLDDYDIVAAMKEWVSCDDFVLSSLCKMILNRDLLKVKLKKKSLGDHKVKRKLTEVMQQYELTEEEAKYFVFKGKVSNVAYNPTSESIQILHKNQKITDVVKTSDQLNLEALSQPVVKYYICYPK